ncbi:MAG: methylated-DNA--[protein]-cysteine S-methyltransferase [Gemmatimonadales bacterium]
MSRQQTTGRYIFPTPIGGCRLDWEEGRLTRITLLNGRDASVRDADSARVPASVERVARALTGHLGGAMDDLATIPLDLDHLAPFHQRVYRAARQIPPGRTVSYGALAAMAGSPGAARAVGQAMRRNPFPLVVPCHRVVAADGSLGGFSAVGGTNTKRRLLAIERRAVAETGRVRESRWPFDVAAGRRHLYRADPVLGGVIKKLGAVRYQPQTGKSPFPALFRAIVFQQLNGKAAATILGRVLDLYAPKRFPTPAEVLATSEGRLRGAGLSRNKTAAVRDLSQKTLDGTIPSVRRLAAMDDEAIVERLVAVRGIGRWTAEMFLISRLGRPDVMPVDDLGVRKGFGTIFGGEPMPAPGIILEQAEPWRPYRTVATWYLWQAADTLVL